VSVDALKELDFGDWEAVLARHSKSLTIDVGRRYCSRHAV